MKGMIKKLPSHTLKSHFSSCSSFVAPIIYYSTVVFALFLYGMHIAQSIWAAISYYIKPFLERSLQVHCKPNTVMCHSRLLLTKSRHQLINEYTVLPKRTRLILGKLKPSIDFLLIFGQNISLYEGHA